MTRVARRRGGAVPPGGALYCGAIHPDADRRAEFGRRVHGYRLPATLPVAVTPTRRILADFTEVRPGCYGLRCTCGAITEFEPMEVGDG